MVLLPQKSLDKLAQVHPDLQKLILAAAVDCPVPFIVTEGLRTEARQLELYLAKKSRTMNGRHLTGHAVDLAVWVDADADRVVDPGELWWKFPQYKELADHVKAVAEELGIPIVWGGDWKTFRDGPHFELDRKVYP